MQETIVNTKQIKKGQVVQIIQDTGDNKKTVRNITVESYNIETGKILGTLVNTRTVGDPSGKTNKLVISHRDEVRAWLAS
jgi:hypothetical protein